MSNFLWEIPAISFLQKSTKAISRGWFHGSPEVYSRRSVMPSGDCGGLGGGSPMLGSSSSDSSGPLLQKSKREYGIIKIAAIERGRQGSKTALLFLLLQNNLWSSQYTLLRPLTSLLEWHWDTTSTPEMGVGPYLDPLDWLGVLEWELSPAELLTRRGEEEACGETEWSYVADMLKHSYMYRTIHTTQPPLPPSYSHSPIAPHMPEQSYRS